MITLWHAAVLSAGWTLLFAAPPAKAQAVSPPPLTAPATDSVAACTLASFERCVQWCRDRYPGGAAREQRYACFDALDRSAAHPQTVPEPPPAPLAGGPDAQALAPAAADTALPMERLWKEPDGVGFLPYGQSYVMLTQTSVPDNAPSSGNPVNDVPYSYDLQRTEIKFAFSLKALVVPSTLLGNHNSVWFAYTQQSFWQALDAAHSRPFIESNYEPELIFSHRFGDTLAESPGFQPFFLNLGAVHQSNGQSDPRSRSWNRLTAQLGLVDRLSDTRSLALLIRPWYRIRESPSDDNNPDITHYLGHGDIEALYWSGDNSLSLLARIRALQADFSTPLLFLDRGSEKKNALQFHVQLFTGYGESLIDYRQRHTTLGLGVSIPYGL
jgi:phospholipase A1